ncbi:MAG: MBL fold metallo-hydrolase, partial [Marivivens sp.]|nr:MBL fold metallo-hydrolase [Marivivens sp.]
MDNCVTLLGTKGGPAIRPGTPMPTSILVRLAGQVILVDAGLGVSRAVCDAGVALTDLDAIIVTHMHSDHYLELGPLMHTAWTAGLKRVVPIYGPAGLTAYWQGFLASMEADISLRIADEGRPALEPLADIRLLNAGQFTIGSVTIDAIRNEHPPLIDSFALRLTGDGKSATLSGDTA